ncbi:uncharacterized protein LOC119400246 [Rhipicephalus sanguineus]|uniref:uncharacterized protein LOC119400246 n=1 Tax=Rhipicephalus sanguineus TaxID=34632 RepID=UPI0018957D0B|nr:uncharacterized protein LOC119400246 [Rhipicephalus sanguineus]
METSVVTSERDPLLPNEPCVASMATPPRSLGKKKSGHILNSDSRNMLFHCYTYWRNREPERSVEDTSKFVADMLGVGERTVFRIGFRHETRSRNSLLIDRDDTTDWRNCYLRDVERYRAEDRKIYLDETWVTAGHTRSIVCTDTVVQKRGRLFARANGLTTGLKQPSGKGQRLILTHVGSEDGFIDGCLDVFRGQKTSDYHEEMDDNAPYHSRREEKLPTTAWKKEEIQEWLTSKNITYGKRMIKKQLLDLIASVKSRFLSYIVDNTAVKAGCIVLWLPPYHCEFNAIEPVWAKVKNGVAPYNRDLQLSTVDAILSDKIKQVMAEDWRKSIPHVMDFEARFRLYTSGSEHIQPIIIQLGEDDTEESDDDCELSGIEPLDEA